MRINTTVFSRCMTTVLYDMEVKIYVSDKYQNVLYSMLKVSTVFMWHPLSLNYW